MRNKFEKKYGLMEIFVNFCIIIAILVTAYFVRPNLLITSSLVYIFFAIFLTYSTVKLIFHPFGTKFFFAPLRLSFPFSSSPIGNSKIISAKQFVFGCVIPSFLCTLGSVTLFLLGYDVFGFWGVIFAVPLLYYDLRLVYLSHLNETTFDKVVFGYEQGYYWITKS